MAGKGAFVPLIVPNKASLRAYCVPGTQSRRRLEASVVSRAGFAAVGFKQFCLGGL